MVVPVPFGASEVGRSSECIFDTCRSFDVESLVALDAGSVGTVCGAEIADGNAQSSGVLDPSVRAGQADLTVPVPGLAA